MSSQLSCIRSTPVLAQAALAACGLAPKEPITQQQMGWLPRFFLNVAPF